MNPAPSYRSNLGNLSSNSNSSDSEAECDVWKRSRKKPLPLDDCLHVAPILNTAASSSGNPCVKKRKVNNIWSDVVIEEEVSETLGMVGLKKLPGNGDRTCESYDFTRRDLDTRPFPEEEHCVDSKDLCNNGRSTKGTSHKKVRLNKRDASIAKKISWKLGEPKKALIYRAVGVIGSKKAVELLKMTEDIEETGGMLIKNGLRRRSPGGVYLQLLKSDSSVTKEQLDIIFADEDEFHSRIKHLKDRKKNLKKLGAMKKKKKFNRFKRGTNMDTSEMNSISMTSLPTSEKQTISAEGSTNSTSSDNFKQEDLNKESPAISLTVHSEEDIGHENLNRTSDIEDGEIFD